MENKNMETLPPTPPENESDRAEPPASQPAAGMLKLLSPSGRPTWLFYLLLVIPLFLMLGIVNRSRQALDAQQENLRYRHQEALLGLEAEMKSALNTVEGLRAAAQAYYTNPGAEPSPYYGMLAPRPNKGGYAMERIQPPFSQDQLANLTGLGELERDDASFRREIEMALSLTPMFGWAKQIHPAATWVYYTSARDFISMYPWVSADDFFFNPDFYEHGFFKDGRPENNPNRESFITEVYKDEAGQGLMVTLAAPVYEGDTFRGTVALDFTLSWLNRFFAQPEYTEEKAFIINDRDQVVALSTTPPKEGILGMADVLPELKQDTATLLNLASGQVHTLGQGRYYAFVQPIQHTPWTYVVVVPRQYVMFKAAGDVVPVVLTFLLSLVAIVFIWQRARQQSKFRALEAQRIAQEQQGRAELLREKDFSDAVINSLPGIFYIYDAQGRLIRWNRNYEQVTGYSAEEMTTLTALTGIAEEDRDHLAGTVREVFTAGQATATEARLLTKNGDKIPYYLTGFRLNMGDETYLVGIGLDLSAQKQAEAERERLQKEIIEAQQRTLAELSTPVIPVLEGIIVMPLIGSIDTLRARDVTRNLLAGITQHRAKVVILDITGVPIIDSGVAGYLNRTIQAARLKGTRVMVTGISEAVAETIVDLGIDWSNIETLADLQTGLVAALHNLGVELRTA
ncbi:MAG: PAS domain S-box protein [Anaerolineae bacterium]|nr:PAS domain S-box protein [Anaerolineae bacterium]